MVDLDSDLVYKYCLQDLIRTSGRSFPALPQFQPEGCEWMTEEQEQVTTLFGWTSLGVLGIVIFSFIWGWWEAFRGLFRSTYSVSAETCGLWSIHCYHSFDLISFHVLTAQRRRSAY